MQNILTLETNKYKVKLENFEGPLDLLCHLIDKNKMNIYEINLSKITDQYIEYINKMEKMNFNHGRIYKILDYIFQKYDKNFKKEFSYDEFNDQEALREVLAELKEYRKTANIKVKKTKKNILVRLLTKEVYCDFQKTVFFLSYKNDILTNERRHSDLKMTLSLSFF